VGGEYPTSASISASKLASARVETSCLGISASSRTAYMFTLQR
jgi:hypothetical protein